MPVTLNLQTPLLDVAETARFLKTSQRTVYRLIETGELPARRLTAQPGSHLRITRADLADFINSMDEPAFAGPQT